MKFVCLTILYTNPTSTFPPYNAKLILIEHVQSKSKSKSKSKVRTTVDCVTPAKCLVFTSREGWGAAENKDPDSIVKTRLHLQSCMTVTSHRIE